MLNLIVRRLFYMIPTILIISIVSFVIIELPPGDWVSTRIAQIRQMSDVPEGLEESLRARYGLDKPVLARYFSWISGFIRGDFGFSLGWNTGVRDIIAPRLGMSLLISSLSVVFIWAVALPIGIYSAVRQYSIGDYVSTVLGFLGLAIPNFLFALVLMYVSFKYFDVIVGGLFSPDYVEAAWGFDKLWDLLKHLWIPIVVIGTAGTAGMIRVMRANLLDELSKPYMQTARSKGVSEFRGLVKYPVRLAINPFISGIAWLLPTLVGGEVITAVVLGLPTAGPLFLQALQQQDMFLAGAFVMLISTLTVIGMLISDLLLAIVDPRIRFVR